MTRSERIQKLANAIKAYRGAYDANTKKWFRPPQVHRRQAIVKWLLALGRTKDQINQDAHTIDGFKTIEEFRNWIAAL